MFSQSTNKSAAVNSVALINITSSSSSQSALQDMRVSELVQRSLCATDFFHPAVLMIHSDGKKFNAVRTFPNEASILHAIFGNSKQEAYYSPNSRQLFISKIKEKLPDPNVQAAINKVLSAYLEFYQDEDPNQENAQVNVRNARFLFQSSNIDKTENTSIVSRKEAQANRYFKACIKRGYCFTRIDLELIAHVFKMNIKVYSHLSTLEYTVGHEYTDSLILVEEVHGLHTGNFYPYYQRCQPRSAVNNAWDYVWNDNYAVREAQRVQIISEISKYCVQGVGKIIQEYAEINLETSVNNCMQAVLESEGWDRTIKSSENWIIVRNFRKSVTHIRYPDCSDNAQLTRMHDIVCYQAFPLLNSIEFGELPSVEDYQRVIVQNPHLRTLAFQKICLEDLSSVCQSAPASISRIENFAVTISPVTSKSNSSLKTPSIADIVGTVMKSFSNLLRISVASHFSASDVWFQSITKQFPNIRYLNFNYGVVSIDLIKQYIDTKKQTLRSLDLQRVPGNYTSFSDAEIDDGHLTIRSAILNSDGTLLPFLATLPMLSELNISMIQFSGEECSHLQYFKGLRVLKMDRCCDHVLDSISKLTLLEELHITGCNFEYSKISLLNVLKRLGILHWGDFCTYTYGSGPDSYTSRDILNTSAFEKALKLALPNLLSLKTKDLYTVTRYKDKEPRH